MKMSEAEKFEVRMQVVARGILLHEENVRLKKRLKKKSSMARHWRKSFMDLYKATTLKKVSVDALTRAKRQEDRLMA